MLKRDYYMRASDNRYFWSEAEKAVDKSALNIVLLAHVLGPRGYTNVNQIQCSEHERFSVKEFDEIYRGIVNAGFYISNVYFNELDFVQSFSADKSSHKNDLIYNLTRNGVGNDKKVIVPAFCDLINLKYTSSSAFSCSLCRNKYLFSKILEINNLPVPRTWLKRGDNSWLNGVPPEGLMVIAKPCSESASQGISECSVFNFSKNNPILCKEVLIQEYIEGYECEIPIIKLKNEIYTFPPVIIDLGQNSIMDEYISNNYKYSFIEGTELLSQSSLEQIQYYAEKAFSVLNMRNYGRIDFRVKSNGEAYIFDVSTTPYTTRHSSFAFSFEKLDLAYEDIYKAIITAAYY